MLCIITVPSRKRAHGVDPLLWGYGNNAFKRVTWQLISKFLYSLLVHLTRRSSNAILGPVVTCKLSFPLCDISHRQFLSLPWQKLTQIIAILTCTCRLTVACLLFVFVDHGAEIRRATCTCTYLCLDCAKNVDKNWNITASFITIIFMWTLTMHERNTIP